MSPALEDLIIKLTKKGRSEEQIYIHLTESQKISEDFTLEDIYRSLANGTYLRVLDVNRGTRRLRLLEV